jgi:hypothetical protein
VLLRAVSTVTGLPVAVCTVLVSLPAGVGAVLVVRAVCARVTDEVIGHRAAVVWALLPQSWLFTFGYTEGLFVVLAGGTLLLGMRGRWGGAGLVAFVAGALRPTGIVLAAVAGWQAVRAPAGRRLRPLAVAAGALLGAGAFLAWIGWHTSRPDAWFAAERGGWRSGFDAGAGVVQLLLYVARYPLRTPWLTGVALTIAAAVWLCGRLCRSVRGPVTAYAVSVLALALTSGVGTLTSFPRMAYTAFPLAIPLARGLWRLPPAARGALLTVSAAASCALAVVIATSDAYVP